MNDFLALLGEIFLISIIQLVLENFVSDSNFYMLKLINIACYIGCLYIIIQFTYNYLFKELTKLLMF